MSDPKHLHVKPMSKEEFDVCVRKIGKPEMEVRRIVGMPSLPTKKKIKPPDFTKRQTRCIRMLAVRAQIRDEVNRWRDGMAKAGYTGVTMESVTAYDPEIEKLRGPF